MRSPNNVVILYRNALIALIPTPGVDVKNGDWCKKNVIQWGASRLTACGKSAVRRFLENDNGVCTY